MYLYHESVAMVWSGVRRMMRTTKLAAFIGWAGFLSAACGDSTVAPVEAGTLGDGSLDAVLEQIRDQEGLPSLAAALIVDGTLVESGATGLRAIGRPEEVTVNDRWHLGSLTKAMTSTMAAVLVEEGVVSWETTVIETFPELSGQIKDFYETLRLDELLYHTSGLPLDINRAPSLAGFRNSPDPVTVQRLQFATELMSLPPEVPRGTHLYTNAGYVVAGAMLERITGQSWEELMTNRLFEPLGMTETGFGPPGTAGGAEHPWGHQRVNGVWEGLAPGPGADNPAALGPAGTVHSTMRDYTRYVVAHLEGARGADGFLPASTFEKLQTPAPSTTYALGWGVGSRDWAQGRVLQHAGSNTVWYAVVWLAPERNVGLLAFTNAGGDRAAAAADRVVAALLGRLDEF